VQTFCIDPANPSPQCIGAVIAFAGAYGAAYAGGNYDTNSSISMTIPA
jgi:hypothetical protein